MKKITVLGAGIVGLPMVRDLSPDFDVKVIDINQDILDIVAKEGNIRTRQSDLSNPATIKSVVADADLVIGAVPGFMGFEMLKAVIEAGKDIVDISFFEEDAFLLDELAREKGVTAVIDCGVAPGMANIILGYHDTRMKVESYECYVGGLPRIRIWPFEYIAPFSPIDVIAEYKRDARYVVNGSLVTKPALSEVEIMHFDQVGSLEAFNTDGLRSLLKTMNIPHMIEKTMRYPGHAKMMVLFRETGLFDEEPVKINGNMVKPVDMTAAILFPKWKLAEGEEDMTILRLIISGEENGHEKTYVYNMFDVYDMKTQTLSMARTTGYTCTAVARAILDGAFEQKGICPPEYVGRVEGCMDRVRADLNSRGVIYECAEENRKQIPTVESHIHAKMGAGKQEVEL